MLMYNTAAEHGEKLNGHSLKAYLDRFYERMAYRRKMKPSLHYWSTASLDTINN